MNEDRIWVILKEWVLRPLVIAGFVVIVAAFFVGTFSQQYSFTALSSAVHRKFAPAYERKLSHPLLAELRGGGFTLFVRHGSRDGIELPGTVVLDRAYVTDPSLVPADFRWGSCLNEFGRVESRLFGYFLKAARIPVGEVLASPLCRARETAELSVGRVDRLELHLVHDGVLGSPAERAERTVRLRLLLARAPTKGTNRLIFSHDNVLETQGYEKLSIEQAGMAILQHTAKDLKIRAIVPLREMLNTLPSTLPTRP